MPGARCWPREGPPLPRTRLPTPPGAPVGQRSQCSPLLPRPALPPLGPRPDPGPAAHPPRDGPLPSPEAGAETAARPAARLTSAALRTHRRVHPISRRRGARGHGGAGTDAPQCEQRPPRAAGWRFAAPSRSGPVPHRGPRKAGARRQGGGGGCGRRGAAQTRADASQDRRRLTTPRRSSPTSARSSRRGTPPQAQPPCVTSARPGTRD